MYVLPDPEYHFLQMSDPQRDPKSNQGQGNFTSSHQGNLENEIEQWALPVAYRPQPGDRVWMAGRWIVDCGHQDWHGELHPVEAYVSSHSSLFGGAFQKTESTLVVTDDWHGGKLEFDLWPPPRPNSNAILKVDREALNPFSDLIPPSSLTSTALPLGNPNHIHVVLTALDLALPTGGWGDVKPIRPNWRHLFTRFTLGWVAPPPPPVPLTVKINEIQDGISGTPDQLALVHTYPRVMIGDNTYLEPLDGAGLTFKKTLAPQDQIPIHIEIWRKVDRVIVHGTPKKENGSWFVYFPNGQKSSLPDNFDSLSLPEQTIMTTFAAPGPPGAISGNVRTLTLSYSHDQHSISGDASGKTGNIIHVPIGGPNSIGVDFTISDK
jgi:hypothetical protein